MDEDDWKGKHYPISFIVTALRQNCPIVKSSITGQEKGDLLIQVTT
jgi:hypothetical protein